MTKPPIRPAATVMLLRTTPTNTFEVLLLHRSKKLVFGAGVWVFPGGAIDKHDFDAGVSADNATSEQLQQAVENAAVRETQEECGLDIAGLPQVYYSHWTTPAGQAKRYATWFMLCTLPTTGVIAVDNSEIVAHQWLCPKQAIKMADEGSLKMMPPTYICLQELGAVNTIDEVFSFVRSRPAPTFEPKLVTTDEAMATLYNGDDGCAAANLSKSENCHRMLTVDGRYIYTNKQG